MSIEKVYLTQKCPTCGKSYELCMSTKNYDAYIKHRNDMAIQDILPDVNPFIRESLITGMCFDCLEKTYHMPAPGHEKEWGEVMCYCPNCDANIYHMDFVSEGVIRCPVCHYKGAYEKE